MDNDVVEVLERIIQEKGVEYIKDVARLEALLLDYIPNRRREINLLIAAIRVGVVESLEVIGNRADAFAIDRLTRLMYEAGGYDIMLARWAVTTWKEALEPKWMNTPPIRGFIALPDLSRKGFVHSFGRGKAREVFPVSDKEVWVLHSAGAALYNWDSIKPLVWIACPNTCGAVNTNGAVLALGSTEGIIHIWNLENKITVRRLVGHTDIVTTVAFSTDGQLLASVSDDQTICLWDTRNGHQKWRIENVQSDLTSIAFSPDGRLLACGFAGMLEHKLRAMIAQNLFGAKEGDSEFVAVWLLDAERGKKVSEIKEITNDVWSVSFSPDGKLLVCGCGDGTILQFRVTDGKEIRRYKGHFMSIESVAFSSDGQLLATASPDKTVCVWNVASGQRVADFLPKTSFVTKMAFSPKGNFLVTGGDSNSIRMWNVYSRRELAVRDMDFYNRGKLAFSPDGRWLAGCSFSFISLFDLTGFEEVLRIEESLPQSIVFSPNGSVIAFISYDEKIRLFNIFTKRVIGEIVSESGGFEIITFSPDGQLLASAGSDQIVRLWNIKNYTEWKRFRNITAQFYTLSFSPDGRKIAGGTENKKIFLWDVEKPHNLHQLVGHESRVKSLAFSPNGQILASGSDDHVILVWDVQKLQEIHRFDGHTGGVECVAFDPNGHLVASGSSDESFRLWDVSSGREVCRVDNNLGTITDISFSPNGDLLAVSSEDGTLSIWKVDQLLH